MGFLGKRSPHGGIKIYYVFYEFLTLNPFRSRASPLLTPKGIFIEVMSKVLQLEFAFCLSSISYCFVFIKFAFLREITLGLGYAGSQYELN